MPIVLFEQSQSTYVSNVEKCENYYTLNYLSLSNYSKKCALIKDDVLIKFDLSLLEDEDITIRNASLILPLNQVYLNKCAIYKGISLFTITEKVCFSEVTWETVPKAQYITTSYLTRQVIEQKYIEFNITDLVNDWVNLTKPNYGLILSNNACDSIIVSPKESILTSPKLQVEYVEDEEDDICDDECDNECNTQCNPIAIELQLTDLNGGLIGPYDPIIFNEIILQTPTGISYNAYDGEIIITREGFYNFHLEINVEGYNDTCPINISLKNLTKDTYTDFHMPSELQGKLVGTALINVTEPVERFTIINNTNLTIQLCDIDVQSTLIISSL